MGVVPTILTAWILWIAPVDSLTADRTALAARDYTALWGAGRLAAADAFAILFDPAGFTAYLRGLFGPGIPFQIWPYPPLVLLLARPLAAMPLGAGFVAYSIISLGALAAVLRWRFSLAAIAAVLLSPAVACNALAGQNGAVTATLLIGGLLAVDRRPVAAGLMWGALCLKPQLALLLPICLLAGGHWRALAASCASALFLTLSSFLVFGYKPWVEFAARNRTTIAHYADAPWQSEPAQALFSSLFMAARAAGAGLTMAYAAQAIGIALCGWALWRLWRKPSVDPDRRTATTAALVLLAAPWVHVYDLPALTVSVLLLLPGATAGRRAWLGFAWLWPGLSWLVPIAPVVSVLSVAGVAWIGLFSPGRSPASSSR